MSSSYFPCQPPPHIVLLSMQCISITHSSDPTSAIQGKPSSYSSRKWESSPKPHDASVEAIQEANIQLYFSSNLSEHQHEYVDKYVGKEITSFAEVQESDAGTKARLCADGKFESVAYSDKVKQERAAKAKARGSEHLKNKKKGVPKKKALSIHRKKAGGGWEE
jgi:hypothetical protein